MSNKTDRQSEIQELIELVLEFRSERNWEPFHSPKNIMLGLLVEAGELAEHFQYLDGEELEEHVELFKDDIKGELADVLYWLLLATHQLDVDLASAFKEKMKKNAKRYPAPKNGQVGTGKLERMKQEKGL